MRRLLRWPLTRTGYAALAVVLAALVTVSVLAVHRFGTAPAGNRAAAAGPAGTTSGGDPANAGVGGSASARPSTSASASAGPSRAGAPPPGPGPGAPGAGWALMWNPQPARDGLGAFEGVEDDRAHSEPGVTHIYVQGSDYRVDMHLIQRDTSPDRQRNEVKGMHAGGTNLVLGLGETWRLSWSLYIPSSLQATTTFEHIMQLKMPGDGSSPILTMSLRRYGSVPKIEVKVFGSDTVVGSTDLTPLQNRWLDTSVEFRIGDAPNGYVHWTLATGGKPVVDATSTGVDTWLGDRVRPKWGIYRSINDTSGSLHDCYLLLTNMRADRRQ